MALGPVGNFNQMKKTILISILVFLLALSVWYFFVRGNNTITLPGVLGGLPFGTAPGSTDSGATPGGENSTTTPTNTLDSNGHPISHFFKLSDAAVAGAISYKNKNGTFVRYVDRATGHIYDINPATLEKIQIVNTTETKIYAAVFKNDASSVLFRSAKDASDSIDNISLALFPPTSTSTGPLYKTQATVLRGNVDEVAVNADNTLLYSLKDTNTVNTSSFVGQNIKTLLSLPFGEWILENGASASALITTKASANADGYSYILNLKTGGMSKVLGPLPGLTSLINPNHKEIIYSYTDTAGNTAFSDLNLGNKTSISILPSTLPEKCVWSKKQTSTIFCGAPIGGPGQNQPDLWYQGVTHFTDRVWKLNTLTEAGEILTEPKKDFNIDFDLINPTLSPDEDYLFFQNKNDLSLWALKLS